MSTQKTGAGAPGFGEPAQPSRRRFLEGGTALAGAAGALLAAPLSIGARAAEANPSAALTVATPADLIVETLYGRVRGFVRAGVNSFKGIPYGAVVNRFLPAQPPAPWSGVRSCLSYGPICPQPLSRPPGDLAAFYAPGEPGVPDEDCLRINIWTPGLDTPAKRPVIVWVHGGGFESGSSHESVAYHGENLSRRGDVVVVSLNHRLNALGFLNLAAYGAHYASSANVGLLDIVLALEWVRDNIARFGGDAGNVTLMGQSGGGRKISVLLAMPAASGLFHKAIIHSGSLQTVGLPDQTAALAAATLAQLGLSGAEVDRAQTVPVTQLIDAYKAAQAQLVTPQSTVFDPPFCTPTLDGLIIPAHPFDGSAPSLSAAIPMLVGSTLNEQTPSRYAPELEELTAQGLKEAVAIDYGDRADAVIAVFRRAHPDAKPIDLLSLIQSLPPRRLGAVAQVELKAKLGGAPAYNFQFAWHTPMLDGRPRAHHGSDMPFAFDNIDRCVNATGGGAGARLLAAKMSDAWVCFARTGNPNHPGLPHWPAVTPGKLPTMIFDSVCEVRNDHDREERRVATVITATLHHL